MYLKASLKYNPQLWYWTHKHAMPRVWAARTARALSRMGINAHPAMFR